MGAGATSLLPEHWPQLFWDRGRVPGTKGRYPPLGLTVDHGIPWHTMAQGGKVDAILANSAIAAAEKGGRWDLVSGLS